MRIAQVLAGVLLVLLPLLACKRAPGALSKSSCGWNTNDWCKAVSGDPCREHKDSASCKADPKCEALPYRGESAVACRTDSRCFADNCPEVGCIMRCEELDSSSCDREEVCLWKGQGGDCRPGDHRCRWDGTRCVRTESCVHGFPTPPKTPSSGP
jgi:hypothetical protein